MTSPANLQPRRRGRPFKSAPIVPTPFEAYLLERGYAKTTARNYAGYAQYWGDDPEAWFAAIAADRPHSMLTHVRSAIGAWCAWKNRAPVSLPKAKVPNVRQNKVYGELLTAGACTEADLTAKFGSAVRHALAAMIARGWVVQVTRPARPPLFRVTESDEKPDPLREREFALLEGSFRLYAAQHAITAVIERWCAEANEREARAADPEIVQTLRRCADDLAAIRGIE